MDIREQLTLFSGEVLEVADPREQAEESILRLESRVLSPSSRLPGASADDRRRAGAVATSPRRGDTG